MRQQGYSSPYNNGKYAVNSLKTNKALKKGRAPRKEMFIFEPLEFSVTLFALSFREG